MPRELAQSHKSSTLCRYILVLAGYLRQQDQFASVDMVSKNQTAHPGDFEGTYWADAPVARRSLGSYLAPVSEESGGSLSDV